MVTHVPLGHISKFVRGVTYKPADLIDNFSKNSIVCMRTANIQKELDENDLKSIKSSVVKSNDKYLLEGDILVSTANSWNLVGKCCWVKKLNYPAVPGGFIAALRVDKSKADPRYVYHWFNSKKTQELARNCGRQTTNISNMDLNRCLSLELPLPSLAEQRRIAALLDKAEALRAKRQEAIAKLDQLLQSVFLEMFGDPASNPKKWPIGKISEMLEGLSYGSSSKADIVGDVPILRMNNITYSGEMDLESLKYLSRESAKKYLISEGDILFNRTNSKELVGKTAVYYGPTPMAYAGYLIKGVVKKEHCAEYISAFMNSKYGKKLLQSMCKSIVGMANINAKEFGAIEIPFPPTDLQIKFKSKIKEIKSKKSLMIKQEKEILNLSIALQQQYFQ